jgi:hypothetical protein
MNNSIPYSINVEAIRSGFEPINFDLKIGGFHYHKQDQVELGSFMFIKAENRTYNVTGRLFNAFNNKTFTDDYQIIVYKGFDSDLEGLTAYEKLDIIGDGVQFSGFFDMVDLVPGLYTAVAESQNYISNFMKFAVT